MRRLVAIALVLCLGPALHGETLQELLDSKALTRDYNPVLLTYLLQEGKSRLPVKQRNAAVEQQLARFREEVTIRPSEEITAGVATLAGALLGGDVGEGIASGAAEVWDSWVDAAIVLHKAGYAKDVVPFYQNCIQHFPYESLQARCAVALAEAEPDKAVSFLIDLLNDKSSATEVKAAALRTLGELAGLKSTSGAHRDAAIAELIRRTEGVLNAAAYEAAVDGLVRARHPRAVEPLRKMSKGMTRSEQIRHAALRGLALTYKDPAGIETLRAGLKGGFMSNASAQIFSATTLIAADEQAGFDWAADKLAPKKKKGFLAKAMSVEDKTDPVPSLLRALIANGGENAKALLVKTVEVNSPGHWAWATANIGLLELGDKSRKEAVISIVQSGDYLLETRSRAAIVLARNKDYSGVPVLARLAADRKTKSGQKHLIAEALSSTDHEDAVGPLTALLSDSDAAVRTAAAFALADMKNAAALTGIARAFETDFGSHSGGSRNAQVRGHLIRESARRFGKDARTKKLLDAARAAKEPSVQFLALSLSASMPAPQSPARKKTS